MPNRGLNDNYEYDYLTLVPFELDTNGDIQHIAQVKNPVSLFLLDDAGDLEPVADIQSFDDVTFEKDANGDIQEKA